MTNKFQRFKLIYSFILMGVLFLVTNGCKKDDTTTTNNPVVTATTVTDVEGNVYKIKTIGTQTWMTENLKTTKYRNGDLIPNVTDNTLWSGLSTGAYCTYDNSATNGSIYGKLYNYFAITDTRNIAPTGWHVPTYAEWEILVNYLGGKNTAGGKLKETGFAHWGTPNIAASNSSEFTGLPGGIRNDTGLFYYLGTVGDFWAYNSDSSNDAYYFNLSDSSGDVWDDNIDEQSGCSVRCVKN